MDPIFLPLKEGRTPSLHLLSNIQGYSGCQPFDKCACPQKGSEGIDTDHKSKRNEVMSVQASSLMQIANGHQDLIDIA